MVENTWTIKKNAYGYSSISTAAFTEGEMVIDAETGKTSKKSKKDVDTVLASPTLNQTSTVVKQFVVDYTTETFEILMEQETGGVDYKYVYGNERLSVNITGVENGAGHILENGEIRLYYHMDLRGTVDYLTSPVSQKVESWTHYNEWGEITHNAIVKCGQREFDLVKRYATHDYDQVLGLFYAKARFYDAENRRFTAIDPIRDGLNWYAYCENNPLTHIDTLGLATNPLDALDWSKINAITRNNVRYVSTRDVFEQLNGGVGNGVSWNAATGQSKLTFRIGEGRVIHLEYNSRNRVGNELVGKVYVTDVNRPMNGKMNEQSISMSYFAQKGWVSEEELYHYFEKDVWYANPESDIPVPPPMSPTPHTMTISENGLKILSNLELALTTDPTSPYFKLFKCEDGKIVGVYPYYVGDDGITFGFGHYVNKMEYEQDPSEKSLYDKYIPEGTAFDDGKGSNYYPRVVPWSSYLNLDDAYALLRSDAKLHSDVISNYLRENNIQQTQNQFDALVCYRFLHGNLGTDVMDLIETNAVRDTWSATIVKDDQWKNRHIAIIDLYFTD